MAQSTVPMESRKMGSLSMETACPATMLMAMQMTIKARL